MRVLGGIQAPAAVEDSGSSALEAELATLKEKFALSESEGQDREGRLKADLDNINNELVSAMPCLSVEGEKMASRVRSLLGLQHF